MFNKLLTVNRTRRAKREETVDIVYIKELEVETVIGIFDWERKIKQTVSLDLEMKTDVAAAAKTDHIDQALDYKTIAKRLIAFIEASEFQLIETMAEQIAEIVLKEFSVPWLRLRLSKPGAVRGSKDVGVIIERTQ
jgi:dihydroneopterin aldolase